MSTYPLETVFSSNSSKSWRDPLIKNRIHFQFPESWRNAINPNPVIGIRNIFIAKSYKHPSFKVTYTLRYIDNMDEGNHKDVKSGSVIVNKFFDDSTLLKDLMITINQELKTYMKFDEVFTTENNFKEEQLNLISQVSFVFAYFEYTKEHVLKIVFKSPFNELPDEIRNTKDGGEGRPITSDKLYYINFDVTDLNEHAKQMMGVRETVSRVPSTPITYINAWDRNSCIVYSNISEQTDNGYLGHTRKQTLPVIKYYPVNGSNRSFWVDLFATCDHKTPVILPEDDELYIEAQLL